MNGECDFPASAFSVFSLSLPAQYPWELSQVAFLPRERPLHQLYMDTFKTTRCDAVTCQDVNCFKAHKSEALRRRPTRLENGLFNYVAISCVDLQCAKANCAFAHNSDERLYHPDLYKTTMCPFPMNADGVCEVSGRHCPFAHSDAELRLPAAYSLRDSTQKRPELLTAKQQQDYSQRIAETSEPGLDISTYKIYKCPTTVCKLKPCGYYHNIYDRRRDPKLHQYCSIPCKNVYEQGRKKFSNPDKCKNGDECKYAHTKFEAQRSRRQHPRTQRPCCPRCCSRTSG